MSVRIVCDSPGCNHAVRPGQMRANAWIHIPAVTHGIGSVWRIEETHFCGPCAAKMVATAVKQAAQTEVRVTQ